MALATALQAGRIAAAVHTRYLGTVRAEDWSEKGSADFVTHVDREAEARIAEVISATFPEHDILAEEAASEGAARLAESEWLWVVDPLDGTTNYLHQYPVYCASIALLQCGEPVAGAVVCAPSHDEWAAARGGGAFHNGKRIHVSSTERLQRALIGTGFPFKVPSLVERYLTQFAEILPRVSDIRRAGSAALDLCHLASGYFDGFWELDLRPWDYAAGTVLVREAGGIVSGLHDGGARIGDLDWQTGSGLLAGNAYVYEQLRSIIVKDPS